jgi:hypothetical protein
MAQKRSGAATYLRRQYDLDIAVLSATGKKTVRLLVGLVPACISLAWLPLRAHLPNTDLALVLVVALAGVGLLADRQATFIGAIGAGATFDLLHTRPYGDLSIAHGKDVLTTVFLFVAGMAMGELATRLAHYQRIATSEADAFALVTDVAGLVATGSESQLVIEALCEELREGLKLSECAFDIGPPRGDVPIISRDGTLAESGPSRVDIMDLPIWASGEVVARFRLVRADNANLPTQAQLRLAVSIADQAGASLNRAKMPVPPPQRRERKLRLVRG